METQPKTAEQPPPSRPEREPYVRPTIEKFPPMGNVTFGTNICPVTATCVVR